MSKHRKMGPYCFGMWGYENVDIVYRVCVPAQGASDGLPNGSVGFVDFKHEVFCYLGRLLVRDSDCFWTQALGSCFFFYLLEPRFRCVSCYDLDGAIGGVGHSSTSPRKETLK